MRCLSLGTPWEGQRLSWRPVTNRPWTPVAWVPGLDPPPPRRAHEEDFVERGEMMAWAFWEQYERADTLRALSKIALPTLVLLATNDDHSAAETRAAAQELAAPPVRIELLEGFRHAAWSADQVGSVIRRTVDFLLASGPASTQVRS